MISKTGEFAIIKTEHLINDDIKTYEKCNHGGNVKMLDEQKKLIQEQHRLEQAQMRNRSKEQKARTRRLIQEGAILEKVFPWVKNVADLEELENRLCAISKKAEYRTKASRETGALTFFPEGRTYSPPTKSAV